MSALRTRFPRNKIGLICFWISITVCAMFFLVSVVHAQTKNQLIVGKPDTSKYPKISAYFSAFNPAGNFVKNIQPEELRINENKKIVIADSLEMLEPGVRFIVAINEGPTLANRYAGVSRVDKVKTALTAWAQAQPVTSMDDFSLVGNAGPQVANLEGPDEWVKAIQAYQPEMRKAQPGLASLSTAIDIATAANGSTRKTHAVLYFTPLPTADQIVGLKDIVSRAVQANVRLFIWLAGPASYSSSEEAALFQQFAGQTNGDFVVFSGAEVLPDLSSYLDPLKYIYLLKYTSQVTVSGNYALSLQMRRKELILESNTVPFTLKVLPPNPIFLSPPATITRTWTETKKKSDSVLTPDSVKIQIMVEFPDGYDRALKYSRLFVEGKLVAENTREPFDTFTWNIKDVVASTSFRLSVIVEDITGVLAETIEVPVDLVVQAKPQNPLEKLFSALTPQSVILVVVIAAVGVMLVLLTFRTAKKARTNKKGKTHRLQDPVTQPVEIAGESILPAAKKEAHNMWPRIPGIGPAPARLVRISDPAAPATLLQVIPLSGRETIIGSNPKKADVIFNEPLIAPEHARIFKDDQDKFRVVDSGSTAGTWLNYAPVSTHGARLEHGDLVQFGRLSFRFEVLGGQAKKILVTPYNGEE
jgi:hypothetical protein